MQMAWVFCDVLGDGEQLEHRLPGFAGVVLIQAGDELYVRLKARNQT